MIYILPVLTASDYNELIRIASPGPLMDSTSVSVISLTKVHELSPALSVWVAQLQQVRGRLLDVVKAMDKDILDFTPDERKIETIGTLCLHIAAVEWSWIFEDIYGKEMNFEEWKYAFPLRSSVNVPQLRGKEKMFYIDVLDKVRKEVMQKIIKWTDADLARRVGMTRASEIEAQYTIEWILFHIIEHETLHIGQINLLRRLAKCSAMTSVSSQS